MEINIPFLRHFSSTPCCFKGGKKSHQWLLLNKQEKPDQDKSPWLEINHLAQTLLPNGVNKHSVIQHLALFLAFVAYLDASILVSNHSLHNHVGCWPWKLMTLLEMVVNSPRGRCTI